MNQRINEIFTHNLIRRNDLHGSHFDTILNKHQNHMNSLFDHIGGSLWMGGNINDIGGSGTMGGSSVLGGSGNVGGILKENLKLNDIKDMMTEDMNHVQLYHFSLELSPRELELLREIASQILGAVPSPMWGDLKVQGNKLEAEPEEYEHIMRMPNTHAMGRMLEAEYGIAKGGGFGKALKHVIKTAGKAYKFGHKALQFANQNRGLITQLPILNQYSNEINSFLDTANKIDDSLMPIVDTIESLKGKREGKNGESHKQVKHALLDTVKTEMPNSQDAVSKVLLETEGRT